MKICKFLLIFFIYFTSFSAYSAEVNIEADKTVLSEGDILKLTIEYTGSDNNVPDVSSLAKDFQIVSTSSLSSTQIINGQVSQSKKWILNLKPNKSGKITIKPISVGDIYSNYIDVEVKEVGAVAYIPDSEQNSNSPYFEINQKFYPSSPYVQQQTVFLVTVYDSIGLSSSIAVNDETQQNWTILPLLEKPIVKRDVINGKRMNVLTYAFAAFPQKSGELAVPQFSFEGYYVKNSPIDLLGLDDFMNFGFNFSDMMGQKVPVKMKTKAQKISVLPKALNYSGHYWLPLISLELTDEISQNTTFRVGEAFNRKLKIKAVGMQKNMLPTLNFKENTSFKQYPEAPQIKEESINGNIVTTAEINTVYIPTKDGEQTLPGLELDWFNVETNKPEKSVVSAQKIIVAPNQAFALPQAQISQTETFEDSSVVDSVEKIEQENKSFDTKKFQFSFNPVYLLILGGMLLLYFILKRKPKNPYRREVIRFINNRDYKAARSALISWAKLKYHCDDIKNLNMVAKLSNDALFAAELSNLNKFMYSEADTLFNGAKFIEIFKKVDKLKVKKRQSDDVLPNLYG